MKKETAKAAIIDVVLADDHAVVLKGLQAFFETTNDIRVVALATSCTEAVAATKIHQPAVVLLDLLMPDQPAVDTISQIKTGSPASQVIILTSHEGNEYVADVLAAGALSYILKDIGPDDLMLAVRKAAQGQSMLNSRLAAILVSGFKNESAGLYQRLTEREREVLQLIARGSTNGEIAKTLFVSETTVKSHVSNILGKLYLTDRTKLAAYAWEQGIVKRTT